MSANQVRGGISDDHGKSGVPASPLATDGLLPWADKVRNDEHLRRSICIINPLGFHMRPATAFAQIASRFQSTITVCKGDQRVNGKSPLELMFLAAEQGTELTLEITGADAPAAIEVLTAILAAPSDDAIPVASEDPQA